MRSTMQLRVAALAVFAGFALAAPNDYCGGLSAKLVSDYGGNSNTARDFCTNYLGGWSASVLHPRLVDILMVL